MNKQNAKINLIILSLLVIIPNLAYSVASTSTNRGAYIGTSGLIAAFEEPLSITTNCQGLLDKEELRVFTEEKLRRAMLFRETQCPEEATNGERVCAYKGQTPPMECNNWIRFNVESGIRQLAYPEIARVCADGVSLGEDQSALDRLFSRISDDSVSEGVFNLLLVREGNLQAGNPVEDEQIFQDRLEFTRVYDRTIGELSEPVGIGANCPENPNLRSQGEAARERLLKIWGLLSPNPGQDTSEISTELFGRHIDPVQFLSHDELNWNKELIRGRLSDFAKITWNTEDWIDGRRGQHILDGRSLAQEH